MSKTAIVLGSRPQSGNIGDFISRMLRGRGWLVTEDDCYKERAMEYAPPGQSLQPYDACVITLGFTRLTGMRECLEDDIDQVIYGSLTLPLLCMRQYVQQRGTEGHIVVIGSYAHDHALTNCAAYCAAKAGLDAAVRELGWELTPDFITNIVHPYHVPSTPMGKAVVEGMIEDRGMTQKEAKDYQRKDLRLGRHLKPQDIARTVHWLLSQTNTSQWLSGQGINLYGGVR